jgi:hypothetical protein
MRADAAKRKLRNSAQRMLHSAFISGQKMGLDILPRHFYSNIPDVTRLRADTGWQEPRSMVGVNGIDLDHQMSNLRAWCEPVSRQVAGDGEIHARACGQNGTDGYGRIESDVLFAFVATQRPRKIIQVGCGVSTAVICEGARAAGYKPEIRCIEPWPNEYLKRAAASGDITLMTSKAQDVEVQTLADLESGDLLFIDSTHAVKPGSEVNQLILEVLPRLAPGCNVHFHDIYFPYDYQASLMTTLFFSEESTLLHAFLAFNHRYEIVVSMSMLHHSRSREVQEFLPGYRPAMLDRGLYGESQVGDFPSSIYLRVTS